MQELRESARALFRARATTAGPDATSGRDRDRGRAERGGRVQRAQVAKKCGFAFLHWTMSRSFAGLGKLAVRQSSAAQSGSVVARSVSSSAPSKKTSALDRRTDLDSLKLRYLRTITDLNAFDPILDLHPSKQTTPPMSKTQRYPTTIVQIGNDRAAPEWEQSPPPLESLEGLPGEDDSTAHLAGITDLSPGEIRSLFRFPLIVKRVVNMKSKGKLPSMYSLVVVGNGKGLVGLGEGKDDTANKAVSKAFNQAVRSMDYVERYEDRTVWGAMEGNFGSCKIQMRSRPPGSHSSGSATLHANWASRVQDSDYE